MIQAIGKLTKQVYAVGKNKEECNRNLCSEYEGYKTGSNKKYVPQVYPEPLYFDYRGENTIKIHQKK